MSGGRATSAPHVSGSPLRLKNHSAEVSQTRVSRVRTSPAEHRQRPAGEAAGAQAEHLGGVRAVEEAPGQRVHERPAGCRRRGRATRGSAPPAAGSARTRRRRSTGGRARPSRGSRWTPGSRPHIQSAVASWTSSSTAAADASHAFIWSTPEKPSETSGRPAGSCSPAYAPRTTATPAPVSSAAARPGSGRGPRGDGEAHGLIVRPGAPSRRGPRRRTARAVRRRRRRTACGWCRRWQSRCSAAGSRPGGWCWPCREARS